jgi:hypothetical protein
MEVDVPDSGCGTRRDTIGIIEPSARDMRIGIVSFLGHLRGFFSKPIISISLAQKTPGQVTQTHLKKRAPAASATWAFEAPSGRSTR